MPDKRSNARLSCFARAWSIGMVASAGLLVLAAPEVAAFGTARSIKADHHIVLIQEPGEADQPFDKFNEELAAARSKLEQLAGLADAISSLRKQLNASLAVNQRLSAELAKVRGEGEARQRAALEAEGRIAELSAAADDSAAEIARLRQQLDESQQKLVIAQSSRQEAEARIAELQAVVDDASDETSHLDQEIVAQQRRLEQAEAGQASAEQERDAANAELARVTGEATALQNQLSASESELEQVRAAHAELQSRSGAFALAASAMVSAIDARVEEFSAVLTKADFEPPVAARAAAPPAGPAVDGAPPPPAEEIVEVAISDVDAALDLPVAAPPSADQGDDGTATDREGSQILIAELGAEETDLGLLVVLPGGLLFTTNSAVVQESATAMMSNVAALIRAHGNPEVLILGHTDDIGEAGYNLTLSERRARSVKRAFADRFGLDPDRLEAHGLGEVRPIASNDTREGRKANRRIEVLIVNDGVSVSPETLAAQ